MQCYRIYREQWINWGWDLGRIGVTELLSDEIPVFLIFDMVVNNLKSGISSLYLA